MGGDDKAWLPWQCSTLIETVAAALRPQVDELLVVANRYPERYAGIGLRCVSDRRADYPGPMAGLEAGLYARDERRLLSVPVVAPHLPAALVNRSDERRFGKDGCRTAQSRGSTYPYQKKHHTHTHV